MALLSEASPPQSAVEVSHSGESQAMGRGQDITRVRTYHDLRILAAMPRSPVVCSIDFSPIYSVMLLASGPGVSVEIPKSCYNERLPYSCASRRSILPRALCALPLLSSSMSVCLYIYIVLVEACAGHHRDG